MTRGSHCVQGKLVRLNPVLFYVITDSGCPANLVDDNGDLTLSASFPYIFPYGNGPFVGKGMAVASDVGRWIIQHTDPRFKDQPSLMWYLFLAIQQLHIHRAFCDYPWQIPSTTLDVEQCRRGQVILASIPGGDGGRSVLHGELIGMTMMLGEPTTWLTLNPSAISYEEGRIFVGTPTSIAESIRRFPPTSCGNPNMDAITANASFTNLIEAFIDNLVLQDHASFGLFGEVVGYLGFVCGGKHNSSTLRMYLWTRDADDSIEANLLDSRPTGLRCEYRSLSTPHQEHHWKLQPSVYIPELLWLIGRAHNIRNLDFTSSEGGNLADYIRYDFTKQHANCQHFVETFTQQYRGAGYGSKELENTIFDCLATDSFTLAEVQRVVGGSNDSYHSHIFVDINAGDITTMIEHLIPMFRRDNEKCVLTMLMFHLYLYLYRFAEIFPIFLQISKPT